MEQSGEPSSVVSGGVGAALGNVLRRRIQCIGRAPTTWSKQELLPFPAVAGRCAGGGLRGGEEGRRGPLSVGK